MYWPETQSARGVATLDAVATGRILVIDDDRTFSTFMLAALESKGHDVDWAGSIADGLVSLYAARYDLVVVDLHLPDGNGMEFLRSAIDDGVFADTAAIILTGHDFDEPDDIRVFHKPLDLEPFLGRIGQIVAQAQRRRRTLGRRTAGDRGTANDYSRSGKRTKIELVLYTSASSEKCQKAIKAVRAVLQRYDAAEVKFSICDLSADASLADEDAIVFTPTLVKRGPGPRTWIVGSLDHPELLDDLLEVSGVARRRD